eukprot:TRINITY_DN2985_c0_g1_i1.p1 TRINITY_DN2985_c0_g1~~TRINITY_DN2985_c0_g1_i1.p1  ORF type:complete len:941 (+),score=279.58 TRINITY_DN2985_c0_g1_i1:125-2824(+)
MAPMMAEKETVRVLKSPLGQDVAILRYPTGQPLKPAKVVPLSMAGFEGGGGFFATEVDVDGLEEEDNDDAGDAGGEPPAAESPTSSPPPAAAPAALDDPYDEIILTLLRHVHALAAAPAGAPLLDVLPLPRVVPLDALIGTVLEARPPGSYEAVRDAARAAHPLQPAAEVQAKAKAIWRQGDPDLAAWKALTGIKKTNGRLAAFLKTPHLQKLIDAGVWALLAAHVARDLDVPRQTVKASSDALLKAAAQRDCRRVQELFFALKAQWYGEAYSKLFAALAHEAASHTRGPPLHLRMDRALGRLPDAVAQLIHMSLLDCYPGVDARDPVMFRKEAASTTSRWFTGVSCGEDASAAWRGVAALREAALAAAAAEGDGGERRHSRALARKRSASLGASRRGSTSEAGPQLQGVAYVKRLRDLLGLPEEADAYGAEAAAELTGETAPLLSPEQLSAHSLSAITMAANAPPPKPAPPPAAPGLRPPRRAGSTQGPPNAAPPPPPAGRKRRARRPRVIVAPPPAAAPEEGEEGAARALASPAAAASPQVVVPARHGGGPQWFELGETRRPHVVVGADGGSATVAAGMRCARTDFSLAQSSPLLVEYFRYMQIARDDAKHCVRLTPRTELDRRGCDVSYEALAQASLDTAEDVIRRGDEEGVRLEAERRHGEDLLARQLGRLNSTWLADLQAAATAHKKLMARDPAGAPKPRARKPRPPVPHHQPSSRLRSYPARSARPRRAPDDGASSDSGGGADDEREADAADPAAEKNMTEYLALFGGDAAAAASPEAGSTLPDLTPHAPSARPAAAAAPPPLRTMALQSAKEFLTTSPKALPHSQYSPHRGRVSPPRAAPAPPAGARPTLRRWRCAPPSKPAGPVSEEGGTPPEELSLPGLPTGFAVQARMV